MKIRKELLGLYYSEASLLLIYTKDQFLNNAIVRIDEFLLTNLFHHQIPFLEEEEVSKYLIVNKETVKLPLLCLIVPNLIIRRYMLIPLIRISKYLTILN